MNKLMLLPLILISFFILVGCGTPQYKTVEEEIRARKLKRAEEIKESIKICNDYGGRVIYDSEGEYQDCLLNGQIQ